MHGIIRKRKIMLGIDSKETPIVTGIYAKNIREAARRVYLREQNRADKKIAARSATVKKEYNAVWK